MARRYNSIPRSVRTYNQNPKNLVPGRVQMSAKAIEARGAMLDKLVAEHGFETVQAWCLDPAKASMINAMAQMTADSSKEQPDGR